MNRGLAAYGEYNYDVLFTLNDDGEVKAHFESFEGFVDEDVLD
jgi:hypothetical protein